jgi:NAD(P)-dependent dehydrogenase (short-subunit alcohol dehydrogenase family)
VDRSALITGGTGGLGAAVTSRFLADGWRVVVPWVVERELERVEPREGLELAQADLSDPRAVQGVVDLAASEQGAPLNAVVNLVGGYFAGPRVHETEPEDFERQVTLNLRPTFLVTRAALPHLIACGGGAVICMGTRAALNPFKGAAAYAASKAAVIAFAQAVAVDYRDDGVRANALLPSVIDTPANRAQMPDADHSKWVAPETIAATIAFLCSEAGAATSGAAIPVYGRA